MPSRFVGAAVFALLCGLLSCTTTDRAADRPRTPESTSPTPTASPTSSESAGSVESGVDDDAFTRLLVRFMDARVAGRGAEAYLCCEARSYALIYGNEELGRPDLYVVESRVDDSRSQVTFRVAYEGQYRSEPEDIVVRRVGSPAALKVAEIHFLGD